MEIDLTTYLTKTYEGGNGQHDGDVLAVVDVPVKFVDSFKNKITFEVIIFLYN